MGAKERAERVLRIQEGDTKPEDEFERRCLEFYNYLKKEIKDPWFYWDEWMRENFETIKTYSLSKDPVLLLGDSGCGKEIVSRFIHFLSGRKEKPFYPINCSSQSEELLYSELFGHEKGAFTGADRRRIGKLLSADGGTVFLDEIQSSSIRFQNSLLRFLDYGEIQPLGSERIERADVRVISASSLNSERLRYALYEPFFWRIKGLELSIPSFSEREDREGYIYYFLLKESKKLGKELKIEIEALEELKRGGWEGNLRELRNAIHRLVLMNDGVIKREDVLKVLRKGENSNISEGRSLKEKLLEFEREIIKKALKENGWNIKKTAEVLKTTRQHLQRRIKRLRIKIEN